MTQGLKVLSWTVLTLALGAGVGCSDDSEDSGDEHDHSDGDHDGNAGSGDHDAGGVKGTAGDGDAPAMAAFELKFAVVAGDKAVGCTDTIDGLGPDGKHAIGLSDVRFYVSNLTFMDARGKVVEHVLEEDAFQYSGDAGTVSLVDLTGNTEGTCAPDAISAAEGTARTHTAVTGMTYPEKVVAVSFDVGVPQPLMKEVIADNTIEGAPSPLNEMYWNWASGYRHFVVNMAVVGSEKGDGYLHVGSADCGPMEGRALEDRDSCTFVNTPKVALSDFDLASDVIDIDIAKLVAGMGFVADIYEMDSNGDFVLAGQGPGIACHSMPEQPDCPHLFEHLGLDLDSGAASAEGNVVFVKD